ncbi:MAG: YbeD family protein [Succinivibrionaceae bacterium]
MIINDSQKSFKDLMEFPSRITFSVIGKIGETSEEMIRGVIEENHKLKVYNPVTTQKSSKGNYQSFRVTTKVQSEEQLKQLYTDLGKIPGVRYVL